MTERDETQELAFEDALEGLESAVADLEAGDLTLDEALARFEEGVRFARATRARLGEAEARLKLLTEDGTEEDFDA